MVWTVVELSKPAGYADHKPPYDFKHGWVPVSGAAKTATPHKQAGSGSISGNLRSFKVSGKLDAEAKAGTLGPRREPRRTEEQLKAEEHLRQDPRAKRERASTQKLESEWESSVQTKRPLTSDEEAAIDDYQWGYHDETEETLYRELNAWKRNDHKAPNLSKTGIEQLEDVDGGLASALEVSRTSRDVTVYRGLAEGRPPLKVGDILTDKTWSSTSYDPTVAHRFISGNPSAGKILVIDLPKGTPVVRAQSNEELELIMGDNTPIQITKQDGMFYYAELI